MLCSRSIPDASTLRMASKSDTEPTPPQQRETTDPTWLVRLPPQLRDPADRLARTAAAAPAHCRWLLGRSRSARAMAGPSPGRSPSGRHGRRQPGGKASGGRRWKAPPSPWASRRATPSRTGLPASAPQESRSNESECSPASPGKNSGAAWELLDGTPPRTSAGHAPARFLTQRAAERPVDQGAAGLSRAGRPTSRPRRPPAPQGTRFSVQPPSTGPEPVRARTTVLLAAASVRLRRHTGRTPIVRQPAPHGSPDHAATVPTATDAAAGGPPVQTWRWRHAAARPTGANPPYASCGPRPLAGRTSRFDAHGERRTPDAWTAGVAQLHVQGDLVVPRNRRFRSRPRTLTNPSLCLPLGGSTALGHSVRSLRTRAARVGAALRGRLQSSPPSPWPVVVWLASRSPGRPAPTGRPPRPRAQRVHVQIERLRPLVDDPLAHSRARRRSTPR